MIAYGGKNVTSVMCCKENKNRRRKEKKEIKKGTTTINNFKLITSARADEKNHPELPGSCPKMYCVITLELISDPVMCFVAEPSAEYLPHTTLLSPSYIQALKRAELGYGEYCEASYYMRNCTHGTHFKNEVFGG